MPPPVGVAVKVTPVPEQMVLPGLAAIVTDAGVLVLTDIVVLAVAVAGTTHPLTFGVITTLTTSPLFRLLLPQLLVVATLLPFSFHWYVGTGPPLVAVTVKLTAVPGHIAVLGVFVIVTPGTIGVVWLMVIVFEVAGLGDAQEILLVICTLYTSPLPGASVKVLSPVPTLPPFFFHW